MMYAWWLIAVVFGSSLLGGCFPTALRSSKPLSIAIYDDPASLSPEQAKRALDLSISKLIFEGLTRENPYKSDHVEFALASHYTISADEKTYTFFIKHNAAWSNGTPITSQDIARAWEHAKTFSPHHRAFEGINFKSCSPSSITLTLDSPNPKLLQLLAFPAFAIFNPDNLNVFSGPFQIITYNHGHCLLLEKNPHYYDKDKVNITNISLLVIPDLYTGSLLLNREKIHWLGQPWHQGLTKELKENTPYHYTCYPVEGAFWLILNTKDPFLSQINNRYRLAAAINREEIINHALQGGQEPAYTLSRNSTPHYPYKKQKLISPTEKLTLSYPSNILRCQSVAEILKEQCKSVGLDLFLEGLEYHVFLSKRQMGDFTIATATGVAYYPSASLIPQAERLVKNLEIIPLYHMNYDYITIFPIEKILHNASGAVDLKYAHLP
ncbi:ABC transporter/periplasmic oligopeptide binding lipoprotein component [Chlamydia felis Fe/C-56]|uniref:ABC transporter/periplasmic oligopeptide binding lipoprotein component n=1 Tax=Chlamydia felis (strain Fe/C-56) TaxID=264202 RepID=Q254W1_CHLFF|nr:ABC transporter substrate-binding protein [Chlamydia felis]BAE81177.1 ABC transporter/periplasmic oligopeptide binding lipoprotein component [Chlamydia felis Fe/C-56]